MTRSSARLNLPGLQGGINWPGASYDPETHMLYLFAKNQIEVTGVMQGPDGKVVQRGGQPAAGSADANGGAFGGVASLKGAVGPGRGSIGTRRAHRSHRAGHDLHRGHSR